MSKPRPSLEERVRELAERLEAWVGSVFGAPAPVLVPVPVPVRTRSRHRG